MKTRIWRTRAGRWYITWPDGDVSSCSGFEDAIERFDAAVRKYTREFSLLG